VAVVLGATSDIGTALCLELAAAGACPWLVGRNVAALAERAKRLTRVSRHVRVHPVDLGSDASVAELAASLTRESRRVDLLVLCSGVFEMAPHEHAPIGDLDRQYRTNVRGPYLLIQSLLPLLRSCRGQIVFVNSTVGLQARAGVGQYASTQHALRAIADTLRSEVNGDGIRVLTVYLGRTATQRQATIFRLEGRPYRPELLVQPQDVARMILAALRLPRTAEVTEIRMRPLAKSY
jgi:NADP-dependent 3-hydroxy acid dehydrogenase YdfG